MIKAAWLWFIVVQILHLVAWLVGLVLLAPLCYFKMWGDNGVSIKSPDRIIDSWTLPINSIYGNPEDGVSGKYAVVAGTSYLPTSNPSIRAYRWSALRNSADGLKYLTAWKKGPMLFSKYYTLFGKQHHTKGGWQNENGFNVPVLRFW